MLVLLIILSLSLILGFIFLGFKLSETIKEADNKALFWILYFVSLLTILQLIICFILTNSSDIRTFNFFDLRYL